MQNDCNLQQKSQKEWKISKNLSRGGEKQKSEEAEKNNEKGQSQMKLREGGENFKLFTSSMIVSSIQCRTF